MKLIICITAFGLTAMVLAEDLQNLLKQSNDKFTAQMFHEVATDENNAGKNVILSALSVLPPLGQLALASVGESHDELLNVISIPNDAQVEEVFSKLNEELSKVKGVELRMANRIYIAEDAKLNQNFAAKSKEVFNTTVKNLDFSKNEESVNEINSWVENQTNHKIKNLLSKASVGASTHAVLVNAIYFQGTWIHKFNKNLTANKDFHVSKSQTIKVPTMISNENLQYGESVDLDAKLLKMSYEGEDTAFLVVLPNQVDGITNLLEKLKDPSVLHNARSNTTTCTVDVTIPKFKIETKTDLKQVLLQMHVTKLFSATEAKLNNLLDNGSLSISGAVQKAFIEVNEEGTEAAAANAFILVGSSGVPLQRKTFEVDRPFYFEVLYKSTPLFNGVVVNPTY